RRSDNGRIDRRPLQRLVDGDGRIEICDQDPAKVRGLPTKGEAGHTTLDNIASVTGGSPDYCALPSFSVVTTDDSAVPWAVGAERRRSTVPTAAPRPEPHSTGARPRGSLRGHCRLGRRAAAGGVPRAVGQRLVPVRKRQVEGRQGSST